MKGLQFSLQREIRMKKGILTIVSVVCIAFLVLLFMRETKDRLFILFYQEDSGGFYPYWAEWSYYDGKISAINNPVKITMLPLNYQPDILYEEQWFSQEPSAEIGRNVYLREGETRHEFHVQTASDFMDISLVRPDEISEEEWEKAELLKADYDTGKKELTLVLEINPMSIEENNILLAAKMALGSPDKVTWTIFELDTEEYFDYQLGSQVVMADGWLYGTGREHPIRISLEDGRVEKLTELDKTVRNLVLDTGDEEKLISTRYVLPVGRCGEMTIWSWLIVTAEDTEELYCLFEHQKLVSAIHLQTNGTWNIYDGEGNVSKANMDKVYRNEVYFPQ